MEDAMGKINWARVILGGLFAGVIVNLSEFLVNGVLLSRDWQAAMEALGRSTPPKSFLAILVTWGFLAGISIVWLYAAARPRFGPGPKTALLTGFAFWFFSYALPSFGQLAFGLFPRHLVAIGALAGLVEVIIASLAGAWLYQEPTAPVGQNS
jgi:hypothetical protein